MDNARPHISKKSSEKLNDLGIELLPHPPYSLDLAPSDYHVFRSMQSFFAGKEFKDRAEKKDDTIPPVQACGTNVGMVNVVKFLKRKCFCHGASTLRSMPRIGNVSSGIPARRPPSSPAQFTTISKPSSAS
ncbi:hypothetical protein ANCCEY_10052 [Ancylostoma ceylanicum]|uniref:Tc1-like transposase DDE domain-containing protein n=1 Tax=Ancylostoma ceylanicum TaxID=53326 RepID=A0A0D6LLH7_9BILA|nr:hypothetical protein ANCCEY_10052 [Ancylostoma ceylanicum]